MRIIVRIGLFLMIGVVGCQSNHPENKKVAQFRDTIHDYRIPDTNRFGDPVFSNMYLNVQLTEFFRKGEDNFHSEWLHEISTQNRYITTATKAIKLGIYAVDFNYTRMYEQFQESDHYLRIVVNYASSLGIPDDFSREAVYKIERSIADADSFENIANEVYSETVHFLKMNDNEYAVALVVIGGWTEAMYLSANILESNSFSEDYLQLFLKQVESLQEILKISSSFVDHEEVKEVYARLIALHEQMKTTHDAFQEEKDFQQHLQETIKEIRDMREYLITFS